jgi:hypothetical protein
MPGVLNGQCGVRSRLRRESLQMRSRPEPLQSVTV